MACGDSEVEHHLRPVAEQQWLDGAFRDSGTPTEGSKLDGWVLNMRPISGLQWLLRHWG